LKTKTLAASHRPGGLARLKAELAQLFHDMHLEEQWNDAEARSQAVTAVAG
jgi:predicted metal-dependent HD superfamily phosphohydrolase